MTHLQITVIVGSLRRDSFNQKFVTALGRQGSADFTFEQMNIGELLLYNQDDDALNSH